MNCNHHNTVDWYPNDGNLNEMPMAIVTPARTLLCLHLCLDCGITFGDKPKVRTAATLRILKGKKVTHEHR